MLSNAISSSSSPGFWFNGYVDREREREPGVESEFVVPVDEIFMVTGGLRGESPAGPSGATDSEGEMGKWVLPPAPRGKLTPR